MSIDDFTKKSTQIVIVMLQRQIRRWRNHMKHIYLQDKNRQTHPCTPKCIRYKVGLLSRGINTNLHTFWVSFKSSHYWFSNKKNCKPIC